MKEKIGIIDINKLLGTGSVSLLDRNGFYESTGYKSFTTFYEDFSVADILGADAIRLNFTILINVWKNNYKYIGELALAIILKRDEWIIRENSEYEELYTDLYMELLEYVYGNYDDKEIRYVDSIFQMVASDK